VNAAQRVVPLDEEHGVGSLSEAIGLAIQDAYAGIVFEDPTFERGTDAVMAILRERSGECTSVSEIAGFLSTIMNTEKARGAAKFLDRGYRLTCREVQS
jgi:hypothetical protein